MKNSIFITLVLACVLFVSCESGSLEFAGDSRGLSSGDVPGEGNGGVPQAGVITAGEWNDLDNWMFLDSLLKDNNYFEVSSYWGFYRKP